MAGIESRAYPAGVVWAVRYATPTGKIRETSIKRILADEIDKALDMFEEQGLDWTSADLAEFLIMGMKMGAAGVGQRVAENEVVRSGHEPGIPMLHVLDEMAKQTCRSMRNTDPDDRERATKLNGKFTGLCQAIAFVRNPTGWTQTEVKGQMERVKAERARISRIR